MRIEWSGAKTIVMKDDSNERMTDRGNVYRRSRCAIGSSRSPVERRNF